MANNTKQTDPIAEMRQRLGITPKQNAAPSEQAAGASSGHDPIAEMRNRLGITGRSSTQSRDPIRDQREQWASAIRERAAAQESQRRASSTPVIPEVEQKRQSERETASTNRSNARTSYTDLRNTRDSIKAKADDMMAAYDQKISAGASKEDLADEYAKIMKQYGLVTEYDRQVEDAYAALKQADQEYKDVYAGYNAARDEVKAAKRNLRDVEATYSGWVTDDLSAQNIAEGMNNAEDVKAARTRLASAREAYIEQGGNPDANIVSAGLKGSAAGVVDTAGYLQELNQPGNGIKFGFLTIGGGDDRMPAEMRAAIAQKQKEEYEAKHGAGTWIPTYQRTQDTAARLARESAEETASIKAGRSELGQFAVDMGVQGVQMGADAVAGKVLPGGSLTAMALRTFGSGVREAREAGATLAQQGLYGAGTAAVEVLTEKMFDGLGHVYGAGMTDSLVSHAIGKFTTNKLGQAALGMVADAAGEGLEEVISDIANPILKTIYNDKTIGESFRENWDWSEVLYDFLVGAAMGFAGGSVEGVTKATGLNAPDARSEFFMEAGEKGLSFGEAIRDWKALQQVSGASVDALTDAAFDVLTGKESLEQQQTRQSEALQRWGLTEEEAKNYIDTGRAYNPLTVSARDRGTVTLGGEEVKIVSAKGEDVTVEQNGEKKTVKLNELEGMSEGYKKLVQAASESEYGEAVLRLYNPGQDVDAYTKAWSYAEDVFGAQTNISLEKARENPLLKDLTDGQLKFALELGRQRYDASKATAAQRAAQFKAARQEALKAGAFARKKGTVNTKGGTFGGRTVKGVDVKRLSTPQKKLFAMTQALADAVNINFVVYDGEANEGGSYIKGGTVMVNINSGQLSGKNLGAASLSHELTHYLQDYSPEEYGQLKEFITSEILKANPEKFAQLVQKQMDLEPDISPEAAGDEVIANACQTMLLNSEAINQLARQNMSLAEKISDWISETAKKIKAAYKSVDLNDNVEIYEAARAISGVMDEAQKLWDKALLAADENYNAEQATGKKNTADNGGVQNVKYGMTELTNKPDMHLTIVNDTAAQSRSDILDAGMKNAKRYGGVTKDGAVFVHVKDNGDDVHVTRDGLRHGLDRRKQVNAPVTMKVGEVLSNAIEINELNPRDLTRTQETKVLIGAAKNQNNEPYIALFVVNRTTGQLEDFDTLYSVNAKTSPQNKKKSAGSLSPGSGQIVPASLTDSDISIADLLQYVNKYFPDVLPEEVLKHFGHSSRPEGKLGASALFQKWGIGETAEEREARKESISNLKTENSILRARAKYWRDQTRQTRERTVRQQDTDRMANDLLREYESRTDKAEIKSDLKALGDYLVQAEELDYEELHDRAEDIADRIIDGNYTLIDDSNKDNLDRLKDFLKDTALNLSASDFSDTGDEGFRKRYGRYFTVRENGRSIDSAWGELAGMFGEGLFPEDTYAPGDMLRMIGDYLDLWRPQYGNIFENARAEAVEAVTNEIIDRMLSEEVRQTPATYADKAQQKLNAQIAKDREKLDTLRAQKNTRIEEIKREAAEKNRQIRLAEKAAKYEALAEYEEKLERKKKMIERRDRIIQDMKDARKRGIEKRKTTRKNAAVRNRIRKIIDSLNGRLAHPVDKKYVPKELVSQTIALLEMIDTDTGSSSVNMAEKMAKIRTMYERYKNDETYKVIYNEFVSQALDDLALELDGAKLKDMNSQQLEHVLDALQMMDHMIHTAVTVKIGNEEREAFEVAKNLIRETREDAKKTKGWLKQKYIPAGLRADVFFKRLAGYKLNSEWEGVAGMLNDAQLKEITIKMQLSERFSALSNDEKAIRDYQGLNRLGRVDHKKLVDIGLKDEKGEAIPIPHSFMMGIYMDLLNEDGRRHFIEGGKIIPNLQEFYAGGDAYGVGSRHAVGFADRLQKEYHDLAEAKRSKYGDWQDESESRINAIKSEGEQYADKVKAAIENAMTDFDRKWLSAMQQHFDADSKQLLNEITLEVYGIKKANVNHYFPIAADPSFLTQSFEEITRDMSLENVGFMKERVKSGKPTLAMDTVTAVNNHIDRVAKYCGMMPAIRNFEKIWNKQQPGYNDSVKLAVRDQFGNSALKWIENLIADLNGGQSQREDPLGLSKALKVLRGNLAQTNLTLNPGVSFGQAASYPTAAPVIEYKYLAKALAKGGKDGRLISRADKKLISKFSPLLAYRMQGYSTTELADIKNSNRLSSRVWKKARILTGWIQAIDGATVGRLWYAAEYWVQDNKADLEKGSDEYYEAVAKKFNEVVEKTQPNYTVMQRAAILRDPNDLVRTLTMFMTQRLQNFNIIFDSVATYNKAVQDLDHGRNGVTEEQVATAKKQLATAISSQLAQAATYVGFKFAARVLLRQLKSYRDDDKELTAESISLQLLDDFCGALAGSVIGGDIVYDILMASLGKRKWYGIGFNGVDSINDMITAIVNLANADIDLTDEQGRKALLKKIKSLSTSLASVIGGLPLNNAIKIGEALYYWGVDIYDHTFLEAGVDRTRAQNTHLLFAAYQAGDTARADRLKENFKDEKDVRSSLKGYIKELYTGEDQQILKDETIRLLQKYCGMTRRDAESTAQEWTMEIITGIRYSDLQGEYIAGNIPKQTAVKYYQTYSSAGHTTKAEAETKVLEWTCEKDTGIAFSDIPNAVKIGELSANRAKQLLMKYGGKSEEKAAKAVAGYVIEHEYGYAPGDLEDEYFAGHVDENEALDILNRYKYFGKEDAEQKAQEELERLQFVRDNPEVEDISITQVRNYNASGLNGYVSPQAYMEAAKMMGTFKGLDEDSDGKTDRYSVVMQKLEYIDSLDLDADQKTALAIALGINEKTVRQKGPWR